MRWLLEEYKIRNHYHSLKEVAERSGFSYPTFMRRIEHPESMKIYEIMCLNKVLHFTDEDLLKIMRGEAE